MTGSLPTSDFPRTSNGGCRWPASWILTRRAHSSGNDQWDRTAEWLSGSGSVRPSEKVGGCGTEFRFVRPLERCMQLHAAFSAPASPAPESNESKADAPHEYVSPYALVGAWVGAAGRGDGRPNRDRV